jgi:hypothetical protein
MRAKSSLSTTAWTGLKFAKWLLTDLAHRVEAKKRKREGS